MSNIKSDTIQVFHFEPENASDPDDVWLTYNRIIPGVDKSLVTAVAIWGGDYSGVEITQGKFRIFKEWLSGYSDDAARMAIGAHPEAPVDNSGVDEDSQGYINS